MKNRYEVRGDVVVIFLDRKDGSTLETLIDLEDLPKVQAFKNKWSAVKDPTTGNFYVQGRLDGKKVRLHRYLMDAPPDKQVDHIDSDTLNNRRKSNLRLVTNAQNAQNKKGARADNKSGRLGVSYHSRLKKYQARVMVDGVSHYLGTFSDPDIAERVVKEARARLMPYSKEGRHV